MIRKFCDMGKYFEDYLADVEICQQFAKRNRELIAEVILRQSVMATLNVENVQSFVEDAICEINKTLFDYEHISKVVIRTEDFPRSPSMKIIRPRKAL